MITNKDLEIENISYTNKDFGQIYPELLDLTKKLTNKIDPGAMNESDPSIVLLKLVAFIGDKLNYNIDKNTLEQFITSATQENSVRRITEMLGYNMNYYKSATTEIGFRYLGKLGVATSSEDSSESSSSDNPLESYTSFKIKAFDTRFKTDDDTVYTLLNDIEITNANKQVTNKLAIQGSVKALSILGSDDYSESTLVQLYNLDSNNRIYFPIIDVAQNGIFINKEVYDEQYNPSAWHRVDNLNDQELGSKVFKFGYDSDKGYPYLEFPKDISDLIGDGLAIWYTTTAGTLGAVANGKLTAFDSIKIVDPNGTQITTSLAEDLFVLTNSTSIGAADPESINEAYSNFKKTVGTFNTLVSCRDYSNYINTYTDNNGDRIASAVCVADVRTDPDYSKVTLVRDKSGQTYYQNILNAGIEAAMYYDLIIHGTTAVNQSIDNLSAYEQTYKAVDNAALNTIDANLTDVKTINHSLVCPKKLNYIEAAYKLKATITTTYKVNSSEQSEIIKNIKKALFENFNAANVDFGQEIPFDLLLTTIENADSRIKNVSLNEPDINYKIHDDASIHNYDPTNTDTALITDNVRAGTLPLYYEDTSFSFDYDIDYTKLDKATNLCAIKGIVNTISANNEYTLKANESIQLVQDSYIATLTYTSYNYYAFSNNDTVGKVIIPANSIYKLGENDHLYIHYTDSSNKEQFKEYKSGDIIQPTFDVVNTKGAAIINSSDANVQNKTASKFINWIQKKEDKNVKVSTWDSYTPTSGSKSDIIPMFSIGTNEQIDIVERNETTLAKGSNAFWYIKPKIGTYTASQNPVVNEDGDLEFTNGFYILEEGEYFIYPNDDMTSLNVLGAGTKLEYSGSSPIKRAVYTDVIDVETLLNSVADDDVGTFKKAFNWETLPGQLTVVESTIDTYIEGSTIKCSKDITDSWTKLESTDVLTADAEAVLNTNISNPIIRSVLSLTASYDEPQQILTGQTVNYYTADKAQDESSALATITENTITANKYLQIAPAIDTYNNLGVLQSFLYDTDDSIISIKKDGDNYLHTYDSYSLITYAKIATDSTNDTSRTIQGLVAYAKTQSAQSINSRDEYLFTKATVSAYMGDSTEITFTSSSSNPLYINFFNTNDGYTKLESGNSISYNLTDFLASTTSPVLYISKPKNLVVYDYIKNISEKITEELQKINNYDWICKRNTSKMIDSYTPLYSFFDANNIYNRFTLPKIDFKNSEFNIAGSSKQ